MEMELLRASIFVSTTIEKFMQRIILQNTNKIISSTTPHNKLQRKLHPENFTLH